MTWLPPRKAIAGGLGGVITWVLIQVLSAYAGIQLDAQAQTVLAGLVGTLLTWIVPPAQRDILNHLNDDLVKIAQDDPKIPVTKPSK